MSGNRGQLSMAEQLQERRERLAKRKADDDPSPVRQARPPSPYTEAVMAQVPRGARGGYTAADLSALLDGLGVADSVREAALRNPGLLQDLLNQLDLPQDVANEEDEGNFEDGGTNQDISTQLRAAAIKLKIPKRQPLGFTFRNGALRITRTPGRQSARNCISLDELIDKEKLVACCVFAFIVDKDDFLPYLPVGQDSNIPVYIGRDIHTDPMIKFALQTLDIIPKSQKLTRPQLSAVRPVMKQIYKQIYGPNYEPFYPFCPGCAHSKILLLEYPTFLRLVITSCNLALVDTAFGDNHWYIHDVPRFSSNRVLKVNTSFEKLLTSHLKDLGVPNSFMEKHVTGRFDFSSVEVALVTSRPGTSAGLLAESSGLLRLRRVLLNMDDVRLAMLKNGVELEYCAGSVGWLYEKWLKEFYDCASAKSRLALSEHDCAVPAVSVIFPTKADVDTCDHLSLETAKGNIGAYLSWGNATDEIRAIFRHYQSKDSGKLFHMKLLLGLDPNEKKALPFFIYIGSANFSKGAWGKLAKDKAKDANEATRGLKLEECVNFECGVVIPRGIIPSLLEPGSDWEDIIPYVRPAEPFNLDDKSCEPFNHDREKNNTGA